jgi:hypothetical protein
MVSNSSNCILMLQERCTGKTVKKWNTVNIQNISEFRCQILNRDVWSQMLIKSPVLENFLLLQNFVETRYT